MKKRIMATVLCFVMLLTVVPMTAMAQEAKTDIMLSAIDLDNRQAEFFGLSPEDVDKVSLDFDKIKLELQPDMTAEYVEDVMVQQGCVKIRGVVTENAYTDIWSYKSIDTQDDETVVINIVDTYGSTHKDFKTNSYGEYVGNIDTFLVGDSDASNFIGKSVIAYVREIDNDWEIVSIEEDSARNITLTIGLEQIESFRDDELRYYETATSPTATKARLDYDATLIYNNVGGYRIDIIEDFVGSLAGGQITLIDNNDYKGYDVIFVELAEIAVVDEAEEEYVYFKNGTVRNDISELEYSPDETDRMVKVIKDGKEIAFSDLKEWDVLSIYAASEDASYIVVEVIDSSVVGIITGEKKSTTSGTEKAYKINDVYYDATAAAYGVWGMSVGDGGEFYIDKYGKIAAFREDMELATGIEYDYAYVTAATVDEDILTGMQTAILQLVTVDGVVGLYVKNGAILNDEEFDADEYTHSSINNAFSGKMIKYAKNSSGEITSISTFENEKDYDRITGEMYDEAIFAEYDSYNNRFAGQFWMDADSQVFFIDPNEVEDSYVGSEKDFVDGETYVILGHYADHKADHNNIVIISADVEKPNVPEGETDMGYAYVTAAIVDEDILTGMQTAILQLVTAEGVVVLYVNNDAELNGETFNANDYTYSSINNTFAGKMIKYAKNSSDEITAITTFSYDNTMSGNMYSEVVAAEYDSDDNWFIGKFWMDTDSYVFFIDPYNVEDSYLGSEKDLVDGEVYDILGCYADKKATENNIVIISGNFEKPDISEPDTEMNYAYVTAAAVDEDILTGRQTAILQIVTADGVVALYVKESGARLNDEEFDANEYTYSTINEAFADRIIKYSVNDSDEITKIILADYDESLTGGMLAEPWDMEFDATSSSFVNRFDVDPNAIVFSIDEWEAENSYMGTAADLIDGVTYEVWGHYATEDAKAYNIIIVKRIDGVVSPKAGFAVIENVGTAENMDGERILMVTAFYDGDVIYADTTAEVFDDCERYLTPGDIVKLNINSNGIIDGLKIVFNFEEDIRAKEADSPDGFELFFDEVYSSWGPEIIAGGLVENYQEDSTVATIDGQDFKFSQADSIIVIDANGRMLNITKGSASDFKYHEALYTEDVQRVNVTIGYEEFDDVDVEEARMAADYVFVREYDGRVSDVVIVKGPEDMKVRESYYYSINALSLDENAAALSSSDEVVVKVTNLTLTGEKAENYNLTTKAVYAVVSREILANLGVSGQNVTVSGTEAGTYAKGAAFILTATPNPGYAFKGWYVDGRCVCADETYEFVLESDIELTAKAELKVGVSDCGKDSNGIVWCLYERGVLEIEGQGAMDNDSMVFIQKPNFGNLNRRRNNTHR